MYHNLTGEFLGTMTLIVFGGGVCANVLLSQSKGYGDGWLTIASGWAFAVVMGIFVAQSAGAPNADINPAVTLAKLLLGSYYTVPQVLCTILAQVLGAMLGATLVWLCYLPHWRVTSDSTAKLAIFSTTPAIRHYPSNLLTEIIATAMLVLGVGAIYGHATLGHPASGLGPYLIGVLVWAIGISLGGPTGYAVNPARDLGPRLAHALLPIAGKGDSDWRYSWVPIVGPLIGCVVGVCAWKLVF